jgi:hypothetical protein
VPSLVQLDEEPRDLLARVVARIRELEENVHRSSGAPIPRASLSVRVMREDNELAAAPEG